jgi:hypothetical protein
MEATINKIINSQFDTINESIELSLLLRNTYSYLFLNGQPPSKCGCTLKSMYVKIVNEGLKTLEKMAKKTCKFKGLKHIQSLGIHVSDAGITDEKAIEYLNKKILQERDFEILPKGYDPKKVIKPELKPEPIVLTIENKGNFTEENLKPLNGESIMSFAQKLQPLKDGEKPQKPQSKVAAIKLILNWQKKAE